MLKKLYFFEMLK